MNKNADILITYLNAILTGQKPTTLDVSQLDEDFRELGAGLQLLAFRVEEMQAYAEVLSKGSLTQGSPSEENVFCEKLKNLHNNLNHLVWQTKRVAEGDYAQHVSYLGEFSESFDLMVQQLQEREQLLKKEAEMVAEQAEMSKAYNNLFRTLMAQQQELIFVIGNSSEKLLYCNKEMAENHGPRMDGSLEGYFSRDELMDFMELLSQVKENQQTEIFDKKHHHYYYAQRFDIRWNDEDAGVYILRNVTSEKTSKQQLEKMAYHDAMTGFYNRRYFMEMLYQAREMEQMFSLCFVDIDGLKYVNDNFGHSEGDDYIRLIGECIRKRLRLSDVFARLGGDEFGIILRGTNAEMSRKILQGIYDSMRAASKKSYEVGFSFGAIEVLPDDETATKDLMQKVDLEMYHCKQLHRRENKNIR